LTVAALAPQDSSVPEADRLLAASLGRHQHMHSVVYKAIVL